MPRDVVLDWSEASAREVSAGSRRAMRSVAQRLIGRVEAGEALHHLHRRVDELLDRAELVMGTTRWGTGIDLGAGSGYVAAALTKRAGVDLVYALDPSRELVETVMPAMFRVSGADSSKLVRVVGSFDQIELDGGSLDFAVAFAALHHSEDLSRTLGEVSRVLRPGGFLVAVDRYQPDSVTDDELELMLGAPLDDKLWAEYGFEEGPVPRREVGEHEIRLAEWKVRLIDAGFEIFPFMGVDFSGRRIYSALALPWRAVLRLAGRRLLRARRWQVLASQIPFDVRWLVGSPPGDRAVNLFLVACKYR